MKVGGVLLASRAPAVARGFSALIKRAGYAGDILRARDDKDIDCALSVNGPDLFFLEMCFFDAATERHISEYASKNPDVRIVCFDGYPYQDWKIARVIRAGAAGFINAREGGDYVIRALERIFAGEDFIPPGIGKLPLDLFIMPELKSGIRGIDLDIMALASEEFDVKGAQRALFCISTR
jgi:DNA-binding NarL/FixJ family response regulator